MKGRSAMPEEDQRKKDLSKVIKPITVRLFGNDLLELQRYMLDWKENLGDLSISESEVLNAALLRVLNMANPERQEKEIKEMGLDEAKAALFREWCDIGMLRFMVDLQENMQRRDALDSRKKPR